MGQDAQTDFAVLAVIGSRSQGRPHVPFEHAEDGLDLPTLAIGFLGESLFHQSAISSPHRAGLSIASRPATIRGWNDRTDTKFVTAESMESFGFVSGVTQQGRETLPAERIMQGLLGLDRIGFGAAIGHETEDQMIRGVADGRKLRITASIVSTMALAAFDEMGRDMPRLQSGRVNRRLFGTLGQDLGLATKMQYGIQDRVGLGLSQETLGRRTECGEVRHASQAEDVP